jgi:hypothetical protein
MVELTATAALTFYLEIEATVAAAGRLARAVEGAGSIEEASAALNAIGVSTELDLEREAAAAAG